MGKYIVIGFCILLIALALVLLVHTLRNMAKGRCCEGCKGCSQRQNCSSANGSERHDNTK